MSNIYIQEPPTNGKVLLKTSCGDLDIELWTKEAPKACRNFIQLCMEGYYDGTIFHRIIRNFMAQGGDPTGTGEGGESIYGHPFRDEFHSRLRFVRRGLIAMANAGPHDNSSQFFITLGPCEHIQGKHTIFGKIEGNTLYNAVKLGEVDIGADDRPVYPPKIKSTQVLANPFDDIIPRQLKKKQEKEEKKSKSKSKATKNFSLLSFGEEAEEDEEETVIASSSMKNKSKSMHDLVKDPKLSSTPAVEIEKEEKPSDEENDEDDEEGEEEEYERNIREKKKEMADKIRSKLIKETKKSKETVKDSPKEEKPLSRKEELQEESRKLKEELREGRKRKLKQESQQEQAKVEQEEETKEEETSGQGDELEEFHAQKKKFKAKKKTMTKKGSTREQETLAMLAKFQNKLHSAILNKKPEPEKEDKEKENEEKEEGEYREGEEEKKEEGEEEEGENWLVHSLQFEDHDGKVKDANMKDADTFSIYDPRNPMNKRRREDGSKQKKKERR
ncbi:spliceosome-associated protein CWC27 homolog [Strongylocentrotus purpuratus]|uniref:Spliceosome-associated protein CWC27 homolog n=1 Tax=Strongylocentrotus purpuratus TaxID=7668 RepID=A0A7M7HKC2_STRPU|nr:spliceosome-associated protein CWC27 homolog [Strongylocentrotus purpuratus]